MPTVKLLATPETAFECERTFWGPIGGRLGADWGPIGGRFGADLGPIGGRLGAD